MRIHFDTNVLVSAFATRGLCADLLYAVLAEHQLIVGEAVLGELVDVLERKIGLPSDVLEQARPAGYPSVVILSHSAELLNAARSKVDPIARRRFERLCTHLAKSRDLAATDVRRFDGFDALKVKGYGNLPMLSSSLGSTVVRYSEQVVRRLL